MFNTCGMLSCVSESAVLEVSKDHIAFITAVNHSSLLTYSMMQSPSWESKWFAASQEIPRISRNPKVHYRTHKRPPPVSILGQPNPVHIPTSHLLEIHPSTLRSPQRLLVKYVPKDTAYKKGKFVPVHAMKICRGVEISLQSFFMSVLDGGEWRHRVTSQNYLVLRTFKFTARKLFGDDFPGRMFIYCWRKLERFDEQGVIRPRRL